MQRDSGGSIEPKTPTGLRVGQVGVVVRIASPDEVRPALLENALLRCGVQASARGALVVIQPRVRGVDDQIATFTKLQTQIDVLEHDAQALVEAPGLV